MRARFCLFYYHKSYVGSHPERCALTNHSNNYNHQFGFQDLKILPKEQIIQKRFFIEMFQINEDKDKTINCGQVIQSFYTIYYQILNN